MDTLGSKSYEMPATPFERYLTRYRSGEWRDRIFFDMIVDSISPATTNLAILDIGCGQGFDGSIQLQQEMGHLASAFIGIEPDLAMSPGPWFQTLHRSTFEETSLKPSSVDVAYAIMVLEHLERPQMFWNKLHQVLKPGGVFWALTVDKRHWFCACSKWFERLRLKELYLNVLLGKRGEERYENYPVYYRSNSPSEINWVAGDFKQVNYWNLSREGQCAAYFPRPFTPFVRWYDRRSIRNNYPGSLLAIRAQK